MPQRAHGPPDEVRPVIGHHHLYAGREGASDLAEAALDALDHAQRVLFLAHDDDATDDLAPAVELRDSPARLGPEVHGRNVANCYRDAARTQFDRDLLHIGHAPDVSPGAHEVLMLGDLDNATSHVTVRASDRIGDIPHRDAVALELRRIQV